MSGVSAQPKILVSIATYRERDNLQPLVEGIHQELPKAHILIIDDNSPDGTGHLADQLAAGDPRIQVIHREGKLGLGTAILHGMRYAMGQDYDYFVNMDADFSHHPRYLTELIKGMEQKDIMIGSRYVPGGGTKNWPLSRKMMSWGVNTLVRLLMRIPARDTSGGYRCYRVAALKKAPLDQLLSFGYSFQEEVLYRCWQAGSTLGEIPIVFEDRKVGASKANLGEMVRSMAILLYLGMGATLGLNRLGNKAQGK